MKIFVRGLLFALVLIVVVIVGVRIEDRKNREYPQTTPLIVERKVIHDPKEDSLLSLINKERVSMGLSILSYDNRLDRIADERAEDMDARDYFSHTTPEGITFIDMVKETDYRHKKLGEILARGFVSDAARIKKWKESPTHNKILIDPIYREIGIGIAGKYVVVIFGIEQ